MPTPKRPPPQPRRAPAAPEPRRAPTPAPRAPAPSQPAPTVQPQATVARQSTRARAQSVAQSRDVSAHNPAVRRSQPTPRPRTAGRPPASGRPVAQAARPIAHAARPAGRRGPPHAAPVPQRWLVTASRESDGDIGRSGACRTIQPSGYSELSTVPQGTASDFAALGHIPCMTRMYIMNPSNGKVTIAEKQDVGAGSSFLPVMGLYRDTIAAIGMDTAAGEYHVVVWRVDGVPLHPVRGSVFQGSGGLGATPPPPRKVTVHPYANPLREAFVTPERIDMGVDYAGTGYYVAIAAGHVTQYIPGGWGKFGNAFGYVIDQPGPLQGVYIYINEGITPVLHPGDHFKAGDRLCAFIPGWHSGTETGFASGPDPTNTWAQTFGGGYTEGQRTAAGQAMSNLIQRLGGPPGLAEGRAITGSFPNGFPGGQVPIGVSSTVTTTVTVGPGSSTTGLTVPSAPSPASSSKLYTWPDDEWNNWWIAHKGTVAGAGHANAAWQEVRKIKNVTLPK